MATQVEANQGGGISCQALPATCEYQKDVYQDHKTRILALCGMRKFEAASRLLIEKEIAVMTRSQLKPKHISELQFRVAIALILSPIPTFLPL